MEPTPPHCPFTDNRGRLIESCFLAVDQEDVVSPTLATQDNSHALGPVAWLNKGRSGSGKNERRSTAYKDSPGKSDWAFGICLDRFSSSHSVSQATIFKDMHVILTGKKLPLESWVFKKVTNDKSMTGYSGTVFVNINYFLSLWCQIRNMKPRNT